MINFYLYIYFSLLVYCTLKDILQKFGNSKTCTSPAMV